MRNERVYPEDIKDERERRAYTALLELEHLREKSLLADISLGKLNPTELVGFFNERGYFSDKQLKWIENVYDRYKVSKEASERFNKGRGLEEFLGLIKEVIGKFKPKNRSERGYKGNLSQKLKEIERREEVYQGYFDYVEFAAGFLPEADREKCLEKAGELRKRFLKTEDKFEQR